MYFPMIEARKKTDKQVDLYSTAQNGNNILFWSFTSVYVNDVVL